MMRKRRSVPSRDGFASKIYNYDPPKKRKLTSTASKDKTENSKVCSSNVEITVDSHKSMVDLRQRCLFAPVFLRDDNDDCIVISSDSDSEVSISNWRRKSVIVRAKNSPAGNNLTNSTADAILSVKCSGDVEDAKKKSDEHDNGYCIASGSSCSDSPRARVSTRKSSSKYKIVCMDKKLEHACDSEVNANIISPLKKSFHKEISGMDCSLYSDDSLDCSDCAIQLSPFTSASPQRALKSFGMQRTTKRDGRDSCIKVKHVGLATASRRICIPNDIKKQPEDMRTTAMKRSAEFFKFSPHLLANLAGKSDVVDAFPVDLLHSLTSQDEPVSLKSPKCGAIVGGSQLLGITDDCWITEIKRCSVSSCAAGSSRESTSSDNDPSYIKRVYDSNRHKLPIKVSKARVAESNLKNRTKAPLSVPVVTKASTWRPDSGEDSVTKITVSREHKALFAVVHNVKQAHECLEHGEAQEFRDDIDYALSGLRDTQSINTRCLSLLNLANKCFVPGFRMHIRAHNTLSQIFTALHDTHTNPALCLCLACMLYTMSADCFPALDQDAENLSRFISLLSVDSLSMQDTCESATNKSQYRKGIMKTVQHSDSSVENTNFQRIHQMVCDICQRAKKENKAIRSELKSNDITTCRLIMDTLLSLTSRQVSDWMKDSLRTCGGFDRVIDEMDDIVMRLSDKDCDEAATTNCYVRVERCVKLLETISYLKVENQTYILGYGSHRIVSPLHWLLNQCTDYLAKVKVTTQGSVKASHTVMAAAISASDRVSAMSACLVTTLRLLLNVTHENETGCVIVGQEKGLMDSLLSSLVNAEHLALPDNQRFDFNLLGLGILINLVEMSKDNCKLLTRLTIRSSAADRGKRATVDIVEALCALFDTHHKALQTIEETHDAKLDNIQHKSNDTFGRTTMYGKSSRESQLKNHCNADDTNELNDHSKADESGEWQTSEYGRMWVVKEPSGRRRQSRAEIGNKSIDPIPVARVMTVKASRAKTMVDNEGHGDSASELDFDDESNDELRVAEKHMESSIIAAYISQLIGHIIEYDLAFGQRFRKLLPSSKFDAMVRLLKKFHGFMNVTSEMESRGRATGSRIIDVLQSC